MHSTYRRKASPGPNDELGRTYPYLGLLRDHNDTELKTVVLFTAPKSGVVVYADDTEGWPVGMFLDGAWAEYKFEELKNGEVIELRA